VNTVPSSARPVKPGRPKKPARPRHGEPMLLTLTTGALYSVQRLPGESGLAFHVKPAEVPVYHVRLGGPRPTCDCKGFGRRGRCQHVESLLALRKAGRLS
jgi:hypothetical protein